MNKPAPSTKTDPAKPAEWTRYVSSITGRIVSNAYGRANPETTYLRTFRRRCPKVIH